MGAAAIASAGLGGTARCGDVGACEISALAAMIKQNVMMLVAMSVRAMRELNMRFSV